MCALGGILGGVDTGSLFLKLKLARELVEKGGKLEKDGVDLLDGRKVAMVLLAGGRAGGKLEGG